MIDAAVLTPLLLGSTIGLVLAFTGAGGGVLAVPLLVFGLHLPLPQAAPIALLAVGGAAALGAVLGLREGIVRYRAAALIGLVAMALAPVGVALAHRLPARPLLIAFAAVLALTAWRMAGFGAAARAPATAAGPRLPPCRLKAEDGRLRWTTPCALALGATGAVSGLLTGLLGVGGGFVIVPALTRATDVDAGGIAATSLAVITLASISGVLAATGQGAMDLAVALPFVAGAVLALAVGRVVARRLPARRLRQAFAAVCLPVSALMLARALGAWPA